MARSKRWICSPRGSRIRRFFGRAAAQKSCRTSIAGRRS
jgi:hypothetical protein